MVVYIASMIMRGKWSERPNNTKVVNVTSMQSKKSQYRIDFSPMSEIENTYKGFYCFENYWQAYKRFDDLDHINNEESRQKNILWWQKLQKGKRRTPFTKSNPVDAMYEDNIIRDYIDSRKNIYIPQYYNLMINTKSFTKVKEMVDNGIDVVVYDFDGPRDNNGNITCMEINHQMLKNKVNDTTYPFGHGYVVAGALKGYSPNDYIN
jgi:hypothetical protein